MMCDQRLIEKTLANCHDAWVLSWFKDCAVRSPGCVIYHARWNNVAAHSLSDGDVFARRLQ
jgi:hypothetical protein